MNVRRNRFRHSKKGLAANLPWGVYDSLARAWVIDPEHSPLSKECAESQASAMNLAASGGGYQ